MLLFCFLFLFLFLFLFFVFCFVLLFFVLFFCFLYFFVFLFFFFLEGGVVVFFYLMFFNSLIYIHNSGRNKFNGESLTPSSSTKIRGTYILFISYSYTQFCFVFFLLSGKSLSLTSIENYFCRKIRCFVSRSTVLPGELLSA